MDCAGGEHINKVCKINQFTNSLQEGTFPESWKKANIFPVDKSLMTYLVILSETNFLQNASQFFYQVTHASFNYFLQCLG